jgi:tRNA-dihydrouridine synthase B
MTVSELVASEGLVRNCRHTRELVKFDKSERPIGIQIFGSVPVRMAGAAAIAASANPDFIDINFGCPARKVVDRNGGSSVLKDLKLLEAIVSAVVGAVEVPVTVKIRAGWNSDSLVYLQAGKIIEDCGAVAVTLHARTREQGFSGDADWDMIARLKDHVGIAVIGNGDIFSPEDVIRMFEQTGCDAVMIGRGSMGNPWIFHRTKHYLATGEILPEPTSRQKIEMALRHLDMMIAHYGMPRGVFKMRAHFCHYLKGFPESAAIRAAVNRLLSVDEIRALLKDYASRLEDQLQGADVRLSA